MSADDVAGGAVCLLVFLCAMAAVAYAAWSPADDD